MNNKNSALIIALFLSATFCGRSQSFAATTGVSPNIQRVMFLTGEVNKKYDYARSESVVDKPSSVAALSCVAKAAEITSKHSAELFSNDYSKQASVPITEGLKDHFANFTWDDLISYDASVTATANLNINLTVGVGPSGSSSNDTDEGPGVKGLECPNMNDKWMGKRDKGISNDPSLRDVEKKLIDGGSIEDGSDGFKNVWENDNSTEKDIKEIEEKKVPLVVGPDLPFQKKEDLCAIVAAIGLTSDCESGSSGTH